MYTEALIIINNNIKNVLMTLIYSNKFDYLFLDHIMYRNLETMM